MTFCKLERGHNILDVLICLNSTGCCSLCGWIISPVQYWATLHSILITRRFHYILFVCLSYCKYKPPPVKTTKYGGTKTTKHITENVTVLLTVEFPLDGILLCLVRAMKSPFSHRCLYCEICKACLKKAVSKVFFIF